MGHCYKMVEQSEKQIVWLVYDGECPMCRSFSTLYSLREKFGEVRLVNARYGEPEWLMNKIKELGYNLDEGIVILENERFHYGQAAVVFMARHADDKNIFLNVAYFCFKNATFTKIIYPVLRAIRNGLLFVLGKKKINS